MIHFHKSVLRGSTIIHTSQLPHSSVPNSCSITENRYQLTPFSMQIYNVNQLEMAKFNRCAPSSCFKSISTSSL